ncbi:PH domain-containing protein [Actinomadura sediminis]|uniref:PH domain-containing protein n=1 Tax=Actinomadura sediminis TaxID=1038904 RepID=A0ABW3EPX1_9ACTN
MRRTYRSPAFRLVAAAITELLVLMAAGGIMSAPLHTGPKAALVLLTLSAGQVPVARAALCKVVAAPEGVRHHAFFRTRLYAWDDVDGVEVIAAGQAPLPADCPALRLKGRHLPVKLYALTCYTLPDADHAAGKVVRAVAELERLRRARSPATDGTADPR